MEDTNALIPVPAKKVALVKDETTRIKELLAKTKKDLDEALLPYGGNLNDVNNTIQCLHQAALLAKKLASYYELAARSLGPGVRSKIQTMGDHSVMLAKNTNEVRILITKDMQKIERLANLVLENERRLRARTQEEGRRNKTQDK